MARIATISSSPSEVSRTEAVLTDVSARLTGHGHQVTRLVLRDLPAEPLLLGRADDPAVAAAVDVIANADAVVVSTPVYKAAYAGLLKTFLDLLPQFALRDKVVLPVATGGTAAHVLAIDYALRPVLTSLGATTVTPGWFVLSSQVSWADDGSPVLDEAAATPLRDVTHGFLAAIARHQALGALNALSAPVARTAVA